MSGEGKRGRQGDKFSSQNQEVGGDGGNHKEKSY